jgi:hypothetical protein
VAVYVDETELRQAIINLALNAVDAMPQGGSLTFAVSRHDAAPVLESGWGVSPRPPCVCLAVTDTGCGIPASRLPVIFDPFFTTKPANQGAGLGLYNTRLFVEKHQGAIAVSSREGQGTTFRLWLPEADFTEAERQRTQASARRHALLMLGAPGTGTEHLATLLRQRGFYVAVALTEEAAQEYLTDPRYQFSALKVLAAAGCRPGTALLRLAQTAKPPLKTIFKVLDCNRDDFDSAVLSQFDLILDQDTPLPEALAQISRLLESPGARKA